MSGSEDEVEEGSGHRHKPVMPTADEADEGARGDAPGAVRAAFWVWVVAGAVGLAGAIYFFVNRENWVRAQVRLNPDLLALDVQATATGLGAWLIAGAAMFLVFFVLLAYQARRGIRKARALLLVLGLFAALFEYTLGRVTIYGLLSALLIIIAAGMLYSPRARRFYREADE
ncbi:hypothetical protein [Actinokineospora pegani]|uniref:hypothetical protein n=1 Tax=Actinokineospora pegani TaxID=2654637 RepID=UPI0012EA0DDC|nr:hypothetical protein [Actinokineospora pegani]